MMNHNNTLILYYYYFFQLQQVKSPNSGQQQFYPIPPKSILPNHAPRKLDNTLNPHTANALRNVERSQWNTTYSNNFSGYGPSNALRLDNYDEKVDKEQRSGIEDHSLVSIGLGGNRKVTAVLVLFENI